MKIELNLNKSQIKRLAELLDKGSAYSDMYYSSRESQYDNKLCKKICEVLNSACAKTNSYK